ncbi:DUF421 domain-containing protein [Arcticibacter sp.]|uniref:DUF421 domain-containing protein n=1 Tax=Arcticibacter sp. TaxID=1872630 RepID=UPI00388F9947
MKQVVSTLGELFQFESPLHELLIRGTILYLGILFLMRILPRRAGGELATMDLVFILLIAEAATHALGEYSSVSDALITIMTLMFWNYMVNMLSFYFPSFEKLVSAPPLLIIKNGRLLRRNMRREYITVEELMENLHKRGVEDLNEVKAAYMEADGHISVIIKKNK